MAINGNGEISLEGTLSGRVASVNERGLKFEGASEWLNVSKYAVGVILPERGATVTVTLDRQGFIRAVVGADGVPVVPATPSAENGVSAHQEPVNGSAGPSKDRTIARLALLKAAAAFGASRPALKSGDVLTIAASWERWLYRSSDPTDDLVDAF